MAKKRKKIKGKNTKNFKKVRETEPLLKSDEAVTTDVKRNNPDMFNRADNSLKQLTQNMGIPRQKVRMK